MARLITLAVVVVTLTVHAAAVAKSTVDATGANEVKVLISVRFG